MTVEQIENFLAKESVPKGKVIRFELKKRNPVRGIIVEGRDYDELKAKNFWRIVTQTRLADYQKTKELALSTDKPDPHFVSGKIKMTVCNVD